LPVGILPGATFEESQVALRAGDTVYVVSDGVVEVSNAEEEFWDEGEIDHVLLAHREAPLAEIPGLLCGAADRFTGESEQYDDMTIVAVRVV
jgi:sigma-B regulation protein RsbU (phosphoserine phosphatase)